MLACAHARGEWAGLVMLRGVWTSDLKGGRAVELEDIKFHQCVRLARFENDRTISFIPPDGEFDLMSYRLQTEVCVCVCVCAFVPCVPGIGSM
jgi:hypothetical protein